MGPFQGSNLPRVKVSNQSAILRMIYCYGPIQRAEIAGRLGLTLPTITTNVNGMLSNGIINETSAAKAVRNSAGRRAHPVEINPEACYFGGIELRGDCWSICITDFCGRILASDTDIVCGSDYDKTIRRVSRYFTECLARSGKKSEDIYGIGIGLPGLIDRKNGVLETMPRYHWSKKNVREDIAALTGYRGRIVVENNATARGIGAQIFHWDQVKDRQSYAYLLIAAGVACPLFVNTFSYRGSVVGPGEIGHMMIKPHGRACICGNHGCLEAYASEDVIISDCVREMERGGARLLRGLCADPNAPRISELLEAQEAGDGDVCRIVGDAIDMLSIAMANVINFAGPDMMLIDSKLFGSEGNRCMLLDETQSKLCIPTYYGTEISFMEPDRYIGVLGAAAVAIDERLELAI